MPNINQIRVFQTTTKRKKRKFLSCIGKKHWNLNRESITLQEGSAENSKIVEYRGSEILKNILKISVNGNILYIIRRSKHISENQDAKNFSFFDFREILIN